MFTGDDDLPRVVKVLNQLYLRKKKRYPDEERYKAKDFYAHLGKSKTLALQGDPDAAPSQPMANDPLLNDSVAQYFPNLESDNDDDDDDEEQLIPLEAFPLDVLHSSEIRKPTQSWHDKRDSTPRKGLAIKKRPPPLVRHHSSLSASHAFIDTNDNIDEYSPDHRLVFPPSLSRARLDVSMTPIDLSSSLDYASDSSVFSDGEQNHIPKAETPNNTTFEDGYESAQEADHINYLFATGRREKGPKKRSSTTSTTRTSRKSSSTPRLRRRIPRNNGTHTTTKKKSLSSYGRLTQRSSGPVQRTLGPAFKSKSFQSANGGGKKHPNDRKEQKQSVFNIDSDEPPAKLQKQVRPREPFRRNPFVSTTAFEVESSTKFIRDHVAGFNPMSSSGFLPGRVSLFGGELEQKHTRFLEMLDINRIHTIGDGHIFFPREDTVSLILVGKQYTLALFQEQISGQNAESLLLQLRKLLRLPEYLSNELIRREMTDATKGLIKWALISRKAPRPSTLTVLLKVLEEFSKLQTKHICQLRCIFHAYFLLLFYIYVKLQPEFTALEDDLSRFTIDFWTNIFRSFSSTEINDSFSAESSQDDVSSALCIIYFIFTNRQDIWWPQLTEAAQDITPLLDNRTDMLNVAYILASMVPRKNYNWGIFTTILSALPSSAKSSDAQHAYIDITELANQRLNWPLEEKVVLALYSSCAKKKFCNFDDETAVPPPIGVVQTRLDIPTSTVFERFLHLVYTYISSLCERKEVKRLISKLVASSQYHYQKGRKYQIMFVNRLNLILLLIQLSDVDLNNLFTNLVGQVLESMDMFVYGRVVEALETLVEFSHTRRRGVVPHRAFIMMMETFFREYDALFGMPALSHRLVLCIKRIFAMQYDSLRILSGIDMRQAPDQLMRAIMGMFLDFSMTNPQPTHLDAIAKIIRNNLAFLDTQMCRFPLEDARKDAMVEEAVEMAIRIWNKWSIFNNSRNWNAMVLQRYPYLGNKTLRHRFVLYFCLVYMQNGPVTVSGIAEMDRFLLKDLVMSCSSKYAAELLGVLRRTRGSLMAGRKPPVPEAHTVLQLNSMKFQLLSAIFHNLAATPSLAGSEKVVLLQDCLTTVQNEYTTLFSDSSYHNFTERFVHMVGSVFDGYIEDIDQFWDLADKLGLPSKRMHTAWVTASEEERLLMINCEFLNALHYEKNYAAKLDTWIRQENCHLLYSIIEIYACAVSTNPVYWAHLSFLLHYCLHKLTSFQLRLSDGSFKRFLQLLVRVSALVELEDSKYAIYTLHCCSYIVPIMTNVYWCFNGYKDCDECLEYIGQVVANLNKEETTEAAKGLTRLFSRINVANLAVPPGAGYNPPFEHLPEEHKELLHKCKELINNLHSISVPQPAMEDDHDAAIIDLEI